MSVQNGASHQQSMQLPQQSSDPNGVPAQAMQNMQFGPLEASSGMPPALPVHVGLYFPLCLHLSQLCPCIEVRVSGAFKGTCQQVCLEWRAADSGVLLLPSWTQMYVSSCRPHFVSVLHPSYQGPRMRSWIA